MDGDWPWQHWQLVRSSRGILAMGAGSNKMHRERAAKLALALALWTDGDCGAFGDSGDPILCAGCQAESSRQKSSREPHSPVEKLVKVKKMYGAITSCLFSCVGASTHLRSLGYYT
jgi:hypothetical protein